MASGRLPQQQWASLINPNDCSSSSFGSAPWLARLGIFTGGSRQASQMFEADKLDLGGGRCWCVEELFLLKSPKDREVKVALDADARFHVADENTQFEV
ncbi:MAG: hypothetical protein ACREV8_15340, partial [Gammaproteobacteria bacterium]